MKVVYYPGKEIQRKVYIQYEPLFVMCTLKSGIIREFKDVTKSSQLRLANILWNLHLEKRVDSRPALPPGIGVVFTIKTETPQVPKDLPLREIYKGGRPPKGL